MAEIKIKSFVGREDALDIIKEYYKKKKKSYKVLSVDCKHYPCFIFNNVIKIKRLFGYIKPRVIEHLYCINSVDGNILRIKDIPETESLTEGEKEKPKLSKEECINLSKENAFKHATRFYKSFWLPQVEVEERKHVYLSKWNAVIEDKKGTQTYLINSYSGDIIQQQKK